MDKIDKENLPLELFEKHRESLGLGDAMVVDGEAAFFADLPSPAKNAVVFLPKSKPLIDMTLSFVSSRVAESGTVALVGTKKAGIESAKKSYEKNIGLVDQKIVGNHSALYIGKNKKLGAGKVIADFLSFSPVIYKDSSLSVASLPGVFSAGELDEGTKLLLDNIPYNKHSVLDVGCGSGVIGAIYKAKNPESDITMCDSSLLAVTASIETFKKNNLVGKIMQSDVFAKISGKFDLILANPPFHTGIDTDYSFMDKFAKDAKKYLAPRGEIYVVANSFLSYKDILEKNIGPTTTIIETPKFKVFKTTIQ